MSAVLSPRSLPQSPREGEASFAGADFDRVRQLIHRRAGIHLHEGKRAMVYSRLSRRIREVGHGSISRYLEALEQGSGAAGDLAWQEFVNCLTTNLTSFFREEHHFALLATELVRRQARHLRIWCNAASTGEEPYSLAMTVLEALGPRADVRILCSDIDTQVLATAERGVYAADARGLSAQRLRRHFMRGMGANQGMIRIKLEPKQLLEFRAFNLMDAQWRLGEPFDFVFCRNVMIYFDEPTQRRVLERMHRAMAPESLLFAGHSESFSGARDLFRLRGKTVYERV